MGRVIAIGQSVLDIVYVDGHLAESHVGGRIANMAASLGRMGVAVDYVSECATDKVGDMVVDFLQTNHVATQSIDRFTEGQSQITLAFTEQDGSTHYLEYMKYPPSRFDVLWPKIEENDIVVFGSFFSIEESVRRPLLELLDYAKERKAIIVYIPGFHPELCNRITRVMPSILENLEYADIVVAREADMKHIFGKPDSNSCYKDHIMFYCPNFVFIDSHFSVHLHVPGEEIVAPQPSPQPANRLGWDATFCAGLVYGLLTGHATLADINSLGRAKWEQVMATSCRFSDNSIATGGNTVSTEFAENIKQQSI